MRKLSKSSIDYYILPNKILCSTIGMWPFDEEPSTWKIVFARFHLIFSILGICVFFVPQVMLVAINWGNLEILTRMGSNIMTCIQILFKTIYLLVRRETTYKLYKELRSLWDSSDNPTERKSYETFAYWARTGSIIFYFSTASTVLISMISSTSDYIKDLRMDNSSDNLRHFPYDAWFGTNSTESPGFEIAFVGQVVGLFICANSLCGIVSTCGMTILHISGQFRLIGVWISNIGIKVNCEPADYLYHCPPNLTASLRRCICHHQRLINMVNEVNNLLTPIIFLQLLTSGVEICLSGVAVLNLGAGADMFKFITYLLTMMIHFLLWCGPGQILIDESQELGHSAYLNIPWYKLPPTSRRYIILMILRAQKCCNISTITFEALSLHTLTIIFNTAASYFALLRQMQEKS